jgi:enamine deaminase RidA (YjgF/YER057c/UK114 family)
MNRIDEPLHPGATPETLRGMTHLSPDGLGSDRSHKSTGPGDLCRMEVRKIERDTFTEYHITGTVNGPCDAAEAAQALLDLVAEEIAESGIQTVQEKIYGLSELRPTVLGIRANAFRRHELDIHVPVTWIQGAPLCGCGFVGIQVWGIAPRGGWTCVSTVGDEKTGLGRLWTGRGFRMLHLPFVRGTRPDGTLAEGHAEQAELMFRNANAALKAHRFDYSQVKRTWIYVRRLLEWYDDLNRVRTAFYRAEGLDMGGSLAFPASTGIQCSCDGEEIMMDVLAFDTEGPQTAAAIPITKSSRQHQSFKYGSAFSRGMAFEIEGRRTVHISGTASINPAGASIHIGDAEMQSLETLMCIAAILEEQGGSLANITSATLFCKDRASYEAWQRVSRLLRIPAIPKVCVLADVCRHDLLVEMEAVATI